MSVVTRRHWLSFIPLLRYIEETYRVGLGDEKSNYQSPQLVLFCLRDNSEVSDFCRLNAASADYSFPMFHPSRA